MEIGSFLLDLQTLTRSSTFFSSKSFSRERAKEFLGLFFTGKRFINLPSPCSSGEEGSIESYQEIRPRRIVRVEGF